MDTKEHFEQLVLPEEVKNHLPEVVQTYRNEQKVTTPDKAAVLAHEFMLTRKINFDQTPPEPLGTSVFNPNRSSLPTFSRRSATGPAPEEVCFYWKNPGHFIADCQVLIKEQKSTKPVKPSAVVDAAEHPSQPVLPHGWFCGPGFPSYI